MLTASEEVLVTEDEAIVEDYKSQYTTLNQPFKILEKIQAIDKRLDQSKMTVEYKSLYSDLMDQRNQVINEVKKYKSNQLNPIHFKKVRLNVGGSLFETSHSKLCRDSNSLLATMFSGRHKLLVEADGFYFIDRDPLHFRLILNYLQDLRVPPVILQDTNM
ncbi:unnamed protein product [Rhizopus stolonifer]